MLRHATSVQASDLVFAELAIFCSFEVAEILTQLIDNLPLTRCVSMRREYLSRVSSIFRLVFGARLKIETIKN